MALFLHKLSSDFHLTSPNFHLPLSEPNFCSTYTLRNIHPTFNSHESHQWFIALSYTQFSFHLIITYHSSSFHQIWLSLNFYPTSTWPSIYHSRLTLIRTSPETRFTNLYPTITNQHLVSPYFPKFKWAWLSPNFHRNFDWPSYEFGLAFTRSDSPTPFSYEASFQKSWPGHFPFLSGWPAEICLLGLSMSSGNSWTSST